VQPSASYKWIVLSNTTIGMLLATINSSILLIALPDIFRGIHIDPLAPGNTNYLLWMILSFLIVTAVLVVSLGRLGDMFGRVRTYNLGFAVFTVFSVLLFVTPLSGSAGALWLIGMRVGQGIGGAMLFANSSAIITDAFPENQRGLALGINGVAAIAGSFLGLILGGLLAPLSWRLVFLVSVPFGLFGTVWAYLKLHDLSERRPARIDWIGNVTFAVGLIAVMIGITYGIQPYGHHTMSWGSPKVLAELLGGGFVLLVFCVIETRVPEPMFHLDLFRIRAFTAGNVASLLSSIGRGGLQFVLIIWLQGIWLPQHGYSFTETPLWAGIYMLPLTVGFLVAGPLSGLLSDRYGARPFATGGMIVAALSFLLLEQLPVNFGYVGFAALLFMNGVGMGLFASPNRAGIMNSLPPRQRGAGAGMSATFQNSAMVLSIGIFFSLLIVGLSGSLPTALRTGLAAHGVPAADASRIAHLPPVASLFAAFLGYNPVQKLLGPALLHHLPAASVAALTGRSFFPRLMTPPFSSALSTAFTFSFLACLVAAGASWLRGGKYHYREEPEEPAAVVTPDEPGPVTPAGPASGAVSGAASGPPSGATSGAVSGTASGEGVPFIDRAIPLREAAKFDVPFDEGAEGPARGWLERVLRGFVGASIAVPGPVPTESVDASEEFRRASEELLRSQASRGEGVIVGRAAVVVLREDPRVLRVRLDGPAERRIEQAVRVFGASPDDAAEAVRKLDRTHDAYLRHFYGADIHDPALYHVMLDSTVLGIEACVDILAAAARAHRPVAVPVGGSQRRA
jgi:MFS family permease